MAAPYKIAFILAILPALGLAACGADNNASEPDMEYGITKADIRSGYHFLGEEMRALQDNNFENPAMLWLDHGKALFHQTSDNAPSCAGCHGIEGKGGQAPALSQIAASYPKTEPISGHLINLEGRINLCRARYQNSPTLDYESKALLSLTGYIAHLSHGVPINIDINQSNISAYQLGKTYFHTRRGQFNLSCAQCHDQNWGKLLRGDKISQGHGNGFPAYRMEWQDFGSLHRRFRDCDMGVRAEPLDYGSETYIALELYLAARAQGLEVETPAIRR